LALACKILHTIKNFFIECDQVVIPPAIREQSNAHQPSYYRYKYCPDHYKAI